MTDQDKHIRDSIRESFDGRQRKAPEGLWDSIEQGANLSDDEMRIKDSFQSIQKNAPAASWMAVKKQIIIDDVWDRILLHENRRKRRFFWWWFSASAALLVGIGVYTFIPEIHGDAIENVVVIPSEKDHSPANEKTENNESLIDLTKNESADSFIQEEADHYPENNITTENSTTNHSGQVISETIFMVENGSFEEQVVVREDIQKFNTSPIGSIENRPVFIASVIPPVEIREYSPWEIGVTGGIGNSYIFNADVRDGIRNSSLVHNGLSIGYNFGIDIGYKFSSLSSLHLEYDLYSMHSQQYHYFEGGRHYHKEIQLRSKSIILSCKRNFAIRTVQHRYYTLRLGMFFSHSTKENTSINYAENTSNSEFSTMDYGFKLAFGRERKFNRIKIEYGINSMVGIYNISAASVAIPKKFNYANTWKIGVYTSLRYNF